MIKQNKKRMETPELNKNSFPNFSRLASRTPDAIAYLSGDAAHPDVFGRVRFYTTPLGVYTVAEVSGLGTDTGCQSPIYAMHIHEGGRCVGNFSTTGGHYNPRGCVHPYHAGDMPPLFASGGIGFLAFLTGRFTVDEIVGRSIIIHAHPDDFTTQPSGNAGARIACGVIREM